MRRVQLVFVIGAAMALGGCAAGTGDSQALPGHHEQVFVTTVQQDVLLKYLLHLPADYGNDNRQWPTILFLHGAGERGDDLDLVKVHGPPGRAEREPDFPFIVISPQCPKGDWWTGETMLLALSALLDDVAARYAVDSQRLYLTGLSMGGYGAWALAAREPGRFAAIVPICGGGDTTTAKQLATVPIWVFHGANDEVVPLERSREMVQAVRAAGGEVKFTVVPDAGHDSWTGAYADPELYEWLLSQQEIGAND